MQKAPGRPHQEVQRGSEKLQLFRLALRRPWDIQAKVFGNNWELVSEVRGVAVAVHVDLGAQLYLQGIVQAFKRFGHPKEKRYITMCGDRC